MNPAPTPAVTRSQATPCAYPWSPDGGDGFYRNPVLCADYSDPDAIRHGDDFWLTASSFNCTPGLPILHSHDLVNWTLVNHALPNIPGDRYREAQPGCGVWAPSLRFHAGRFWIFFPTPDEGIYVTTALDPRGEWSEPHLVQAGKGLIDPCPLWDDDGQAYLVHAYAQSRSGLKHRLRITPLAPDGKRLLGEGRIVFQEPDRHPTIEGPKFLKRDGWYYILAPAGGVATGWQTVLRSRNIFGPYEDRIVLHQGGTCINGPHQGSLLDTPNGEWWFLHFQDAGVYGRVVHLQPVEWRDGWPLMGVINGANTPGEPVLRHRKPALPSARAATPATSDEFSSSKLGLQWQWHANNYNDWHSLTARTGWLRLKAHPTVPGGLGLLPNLLLQKFPAREFTAETALDLAGGRPDDEAGLIIAGRSWAALGLRRCKSVTELVFRLGDATVFSTAAQNSIRLRVTVREGGRCNFSYSNAGDSWVNLVEEFQAQPGVWIGAKLGFFATGAGHADFDYLRFSAPV